MHVILSGYMYVDMQMISGAVHVAFQLCFSTRDLFWSFVNTQAQS